MSQQVETQKLKKLHLIAEPSHNSEMPFQTQLIMTTELKIF